jgi:hypothetical protein
MRLKNIWILFFLLYSSSLFATSTSRWREADTASTTVVDHSAWSTLLQKYVRQDSSGINRFRYNAVSASDKNTLNSYIQSLEKIAVLKLNKNEQKAYWINLYNSVTIQLILENYPVKSIREIPNKFLQTGPWDMKLVTVEGEKLTLNDIEHKILRPIFADSRIHYGVNCASIGCPNLANSPYTAENTSALLSSGARYYINHPRGVKIDGDTMTISSIYKWFKEDFGGNEEAIKKHLIKYANPELAEKIKSFNGSISYSYNWNLNE